MVAMLPIFFDVKDDMEGAIPSIQACIRAQKQRKFNKLIGQTSYKLLVSNGLGMSWDNAIAKISDIGESGEKFAPLSAGQVKLFPGIKDTRHHLGMWGCPFRY
jgi:hypothetical protein